MSTTEILDQEDRFQIPTYNKLPMALERGEGSYVWDTDGNRYLDYYGGHCVALVGHCHADVVNAIQKQAETLIFYSNVAYSPVRARAAQHLAAQAPDGMGNVFFCNSGTEANETALKLARKTTGRGGLVAMKGAFHGRTLGSLAATWTEKYRKPYQDVLAPVEFAEFGSLASVEGILAERSDIAAILLEPIQSMAGIVEADESYYRGLRSLCDEHGIMLIFDEVQTGVGRTGTFSISEHYGMRPDIITLAKSLGGGVPVGAALVSDSIAEAVEAGDQGTTFGGGMIAMAAVSAVLEIASTTDARHNATSVFQEISGGVGDLVRAVRGRGCLVGLDIGRPAKPVVAALREEGVLSGGSNDPNVMRLFPPITTTRTEVMSFVSAFRTAFEKTRDLA